MKKKLLFIDIDGTFFEPHHGGVIESGVKAVDLAKKNGAEIYLCTGRSLAEAKIFLNYDSIDGFVFGAGALVYHKGKRIYEKALSNEVVDKVINLANRFNCGYCVEAYAGAYCDDFAYQVLTEYVAAGLDEERAAIALSDNCFYRLDQYHHLDPVCKFNFYFDDYSVREKIEAELPDNLETTIAYHNEKTGVYGLEITDKNINKASGIEKILALKDGYTFEDVYAFGDSNNDISMVEVAKVGVAMGNASDGLKARADYITDRIENDGLYKAFKHLELI